MEGTIFEVQGKRGVRFNKCFRFGSFVTLKFDVMYKTL